MQPHIKFLEQIEQGLIALSRIKDLPYQYNKRELVYEKDKLKLYHYQPLTKADKMPPLLIVFATVNRPEILDLFPERSFIQGLLTNGMDVYLLDWGYPDKEDKHLSFNDYVNKIADCTKQITKQTKTKKIDLLGVCQGGLLCLCYAALAKNIRKLVLISTPIDFHTRDNLIRKMILKIDTNKLINLMGNVSGSWLTQFFISLRPFELIGKKYLRFVKNIQDENATKRFLQVEKWLQDAPDQSGKAFSEFIDDFYRSNKLIKDEVMINKEKVELSKLALPVLNVMASEDEIIPISSSKALKKYVDPMWYTEKFFPSGHIGIYVSDKVGDSMAKTISTWIKNNIKGRKK